MIASPTPRRRLLALACSVAVLLPCAVRAQDLPFSNGLLYRLEAGNGVNLNGSSVTGWNDLSGNALNFNQPDPLKQPTLIPNAFGGRNAIRFDGSLVGAAAGIGPNADELVLETSTDVQTFVAVNRLAFGNTGFAGIWGINSADTGIRRANNTTWQGVGANGNGNDFAFGGTTLINNSATGTIAEGVPHVLIASRGAAMTFNATSIGDYFQVGANNPRPYAGDISEILVFNRALTPTESTQLTIHLAAKYSVSLGGTNYNVGGASQIGSEIYAGQQARYIRIRTEGTGSGGTDANANSLHIGEIEAFSGRFGATGLESGGNLALQGRATFSTVLGIGGHGGDGNVNNGVVDGGANTWTRVGPDAPGPLGAPIEGLLSLNSDQLVNRVRVWNRGDGCCNGRLANFSITLEDASHTVLETLSYNGAVPGGMSFAEFDFSDVTKSLTLQTNDLVSIELSALSNTGDELRLGDDGLGALTINSGAILNVANLAGSLAPGQSFDILDFGTVSGTFSLLNLPGGEANWDTSELYTTGVITVVPEPAAASLLLAAALLGTRRRRQA